MSFASTSERMTDKNPSEVRRRLTTSHGNFAPYHDKSKTDSSRRRAFHDPPKFRPQRSSRSRRFAPRFASQAYFILQPCVGFTLQGFSPLLSRADSSPARALMAFHRKAPTRNRSPWGQNLPPRLQGVDPSSDPLPPAEGLALLTIRSPLKFSAPAGFSPDTLATPSRPLRSWP
jgi:hypothetical protein